LVNDLIYLNEIDLGKTTTFCEPIDLEISFLLPIHETFDIWKSKDLKTEIQIEPGILIKSVEYLFSQTVIRILDNACKFSPKGGLIKIKLESNGFTGCKLTIEDQGPGIPGQLRELVFQRFYQIQQGEELAQNHGMGLGLYLARSFAREWGGDVRILDSSSGCTVRMELGSPR
jgi:signal transduction histidine kinase